jgi:hypothetical protein
VEEQEAQQERADVGHAVHGVDEQHALDPGQVHPARRVVANLVASRRITTTIAETIQNGRVSLSRLGRPFRFHAQRLST